MKEGETLTIALTLVVWAASVAAGVILGKRKHRRGLLYGLLLPVVGPVVLALLPPRPPHEDVLGTKWDETYTPTDDAFFENQQYYSRQ